MDNGALKANRLNALLQELFIYNTGKLSGTSIPHHKLFVPYRVVVLDKLDQISDLQSLISLDLRLWGDDASK